MEIMVVKYSTQVIWMVNILFLRVGLCSLINKYEFCSVSKLILTFHNNGIAEMKLICEHQKKLI